MKLIGTFVSSAIAVSAFAYYIFLSAEDALRVLQTYPNCFPPYQYMVETDHLLKRVCNTPTDPLTGVNERGSAKGW